MVAQAAETQVIDGLAVSRVTVIEREWQGRVGVCGTLRRLGPEIVDVLQSL